MEIVVEGSTLYNGDCLVVMDNMKKCSVDSIVTDPPYHLTSIVERFGKQGSAPAKFGTDSAFDRASKGFMGKEWDGGDIAFQVDTWRKCLELLKPGGHLIAFSGSRTYHRMAVAIEDAGFEIRDQCIWLYGSGFPKSHNIGKSIDALKKTGKSNPQALRKTRMGDDYKPTGQIDYAKGRMFSSDIDNDDYEHQVDNEWKGWGTALKPAHEPMVLARKPIDQKSVADNVLKHGVGGINIDDCRVQCEPDDDIVRPDRTDAQAYNFFRGGEQDRINVRKTTRRQPRSEQNVWTDNNSGMKAEGSMFADADPRGRFPSNVMHDGSCVVEDVFPDVSSRYFYTAKTNQAERNAGANNTHPTVKPVELMRYLVRLVTPKNGLVLDPFMGSGSTGMAAREEEFKFIGIEKEEEYYEIAKARIKNVKPQLKLFDI